MDFDPTHTPGPAVSITHLPANFTKTGVAVNNGIAAPSWSPTGQLLDMVPAPFNPGGPELNPGGRPTINQAPGTTYTTGPEPVGPAKPTFPTTVMKLLNSFANWHPVSGFFIRKGL